MLEILLFDFGGHKMSKHTGKPNRHEKVAVTLLSGKPVTPDEIQAVFKGTDQEKVMYRLSTNIYNIRKDGGIVKVIKDGRKVQAYQLVNYTEFDANGRYVGKQTPAPVAQETKETETA
jgi:hypothetical protein